MRHYRSQAFVRKIEINLANVSAKPDDEFTLVSASMNYNEFTCELCGHQHCVKEYIIKNNETDVEMSIGSECISHFEGKGVDIDLAEGLMRRVTSASNKARRDLQRRLGEEAWSELSQEEKDQVKWYMRKDKIEELGKVAYKALSKEEKRELMVNEFLTLQAKELLTDVAKNKSILVEEDVELILSLDMEEEMKRAIEQQKAIAVKEEVYKVENEALKYIREAETVSSEKVEEMKNRIIELQPNYRSSWIDSAYANRIHEDRSREALKAEYGWLIDYDGNNPTVRDIRSYLIRNKQISPAQQNLALSLVENDNVKDSEFDKKLKESHDDPFNSFVDSVYRQYHRKEHVSDKQKAAILSHYDKTQKNN